MTSFPILQLVDGVIARSNEAIISNANMLLESGEIALLTGPNGSGKSTLLTALAGEKFLASGMLSFASIPRSQISLKEMSKKRSLMLQQDEAVDQLRAADVLELAAINKVIPQHTKAFVLNLLDSELKEKSLGTLSIGQRTRVFLAAAAIQNAEVILLDEPTAGLDTDAISLLSTFLVAHTANGGAVILATHENSLRNIATKEFVISEKELTTKSLS